MPLPPAHLDDRRVHDRAPRFPAAVGAEIARRRLALLASAEGAILDLDLPEARAEVASAATAAGRGTTAPSADTTPW